MKRITVLFLFLSTLSFSQGLNHNWLVGYWNGANMKGRFQFTDTSYSYNLETRKIPFETTEGNISDSAGNLLMSSNGVWIADATGDTMLNGGGLNPNSFTGAWSGGLPLPNGNVFLPVPGDTSQYILFHQTGNYDANLASTELYYSIINKNLNGGLGEVVAKNQILFSDTLGWGFGACKHGNGRDWWIVLIGFSSDIIHECLLTSDTLLYVGAQTLSVPYHNGYAGQPTFSPDGNKFAFLSGYRFSPNLWESDINILSFDRCTGIFTNPISINFIDSTAGFGIAFSPNSQFLYASLFNKIYQINTDTINIPASLKIVAINDGFSSPFPPFYTDFWLMYLAANGKIYISSGNGVQHIHQINYPDSAGVSCDVQQHAIPLGIYNFRTVPCHPNYYLGRKIGSPCDSLTSITEIAHDYKFAISPNPTNGNFKITYMLPQNKSGTFQIFDVLGKKVFESKIPQWSTLQNFNLYFLKNGLYNCVIKSNKFSFNKRLILVK